MTVSLRGYTQGAFSAFGTFSVPWPSGTAVGDLAVFLAAAGSDKKPATVFPSGWQQKGVKSDGTSLWWKILTSADIASPLTVKARVELGVVLTGAAGVGGLGSGESLKIAAGGALLLAGWRSTTDDLTAGKIHATDVVNESYVYKGTARRYNLWLAPMAAAGTAYIDTNASAFFALEILPPTLPAAPTLISPPDGAFIDAGTDVTIRWRHNSATGAAQSKLRASIVRNTSVGDLDPLYLTGTSGSPFFLPLIASYAGDSWVIPAANLGASIGYSCRWVIQTGEADAVISPTAQATFYIRTKPTLTASVSGSGLARTVSWTPTITNGAQEWWRVRICPAADATPGNPIHDTGIQPGADVTYAIPPDAGYLNGTAYKAWVEVGQTGGQQTIPTASSSFTVSWTPPTPPTLTAQTSARPMTLTASGLAGHDLVQVQRLAAGEWVEVLTTPVTAASMTLPIPLAPWGEGHWRVLASGLVSGVQLWSDPVEIVTMCADAASYLVALDGMDYRRVRWYRVGKRLDTEGILTSYPLGGASAMVVRTPSQGAASADPALICETQAEVDDLKAFLRDNPTLWVRWSPERDGTTYADVPALKVSRTSTLDEDRPVDKPIQIRIIPFAWVQQ